jgi:hypothetical protein
MKNKLRVQIYSKVNFVYTLEFYRYNKWFFPSSLGAFPELTKGHPELVSGSEFDSGRR